MSDDPRYAMVKATWFRHGAAMTYDYPAQFIAMLDTYFAAGGPPHPREITDAMVEAAYEVSLDPKYDDRMDMVRAALEAAERARTEK